ncbi:MAG: aspartate/glutamate racemase family protein [Clostridia bacterium]|nr:aspartate/glutamate racemase family protein [Clostridia bacterium]
MQNDFIAVIDSGIGGMSVLKALTKNFPNERFLYFGDNLNAPYGNRSVQNLLSITMRNIDYIKRFGVKAIVLACNTLSVNILNNIKEYAGLPVVGTFPPVESSVVKDEKVLLLSTVRTAEIYSGLKNLDVLGLPNLAEDIEKHAFSIENVNFNKHLELFSSGDFINKKGYYDTVILGCTHYFFIKKQIINHFFPHKIFCGHDFTVKKLKEILENRKSSVKNYRFDVEFIGDCKNFNKKFWVSGG